MSLLYQPPTPHTHATRKQHMSLSGNLLQPIVEFSGIPPTRNEPIPTGLISPFKAMPEPPRDNAEPWEKKAWLKLACGDCPVLYLASIVAVPDRTFYRWLGQGTVSYASMRAIWATLLLDRKLDFRAHPYWYVEKTYADFVVQDFKRRELASPMMAFAASALAYESAKPRLQL